MYASQGLFLAQRKLTVVQFTTFNWTVNGFTFNAPNNNPILMQILAGIPPDQLIPAGSIIQIQKNNTIEITIPDPNPIQLAHPFHLHGVRSPEAACRARY